MSKKQQIQKQKQSNTDNTIQFERIQKSTSIVPRNLVQEEYLDMLMDPQKVIVFAVGPAGTGKTLLSMMAGVRALKEGVVKKLILTRPAVGVDGEDHGFLPGDLNAKMAPWTLPLMDVLNNCYDQIQIEKMLTEKTIELAPLSFMRGRNFSNSWIVFDEAQNSTVNQMKMLLTRISSNSKAIITGDLGQVDRQFAKVNGLKDILTRLPENDKMIGNVTFEKRHVERHPIVAKVLDLYNE
jgi:phosphate starvation-inducible PhoH-like protein